MYVLMYCFVLQWKIFLLRFTPSRHIANCHVPRIYILYIESLSQINSVFSSICIYFTLEITLHFLREWFFNQSINREMKATGMRRGIWASFVYKPAKTFCFAETRDCVRKWRQCTYRMFYKKFLSYKSDPSTCLVLRFSDFQVMSHQWATYVTNFVRCIMPQSFCLE
jgi:hypothetical protein